MNCRHCQLPAVAAGLCVLHGYMEVADLTDTGNPTAALQLLTAVNARCHV